jgi:ATP-dependent exoDNAse (exonuclease V) beta subunit
MHDEDCINILEPNLLILASAGSGKTYQLGNRVIGLVAKGNKPEKIVALTFTRKAAGEFADSVLTKLAAAATNQEEASELEKRIGLDPTDFNTVLATVVGSLPRFNLGTIDSFFAKIVRSFQYEFGITGGKFDLLEGPRATALADEMLASVISSRLDVEGRDSEFLHAFRRATMGRESQSVLKELSEFIQTWHEQYRNADDLEWGPPGIAQVDLDEWEKQKHALANAAIDGIGCISFTEKRQPDALLDSIEEFRNHTIGSGNLSNSNKSLTKNILEAVATLSGPLVVKSYKSFTLDGATGDAIREMVELAAQCELSAASKRTGSIREVVRIYDEICESQLRKKGLLGFSDVKFLMGEWKKNEAARLKREAIDFRIDASIDHWLLDEFQDTSNADWNGLWPLINEAASDDASRTLFVVGDRKQAIYGWRGGDVGLFKKITDEHLPGITTAPMFRSYRSCPEVLKLVNKICGDTATMLSLFGETNPPWEWEDHISAPHLEDQTKRGHSRVEWIQNDEERLDRLVAILKELEIGKRNMTCGVLVRNNKLVTEISEHLRINGFDVIEEGRRKPATDSQPGIAITQLLEWLANPADRFARGVLEMSPMAEILRNLHGSDWNAMWENLTREISIHGFSNPLTSIIAPLAPTWSEFGRRRADDLLAALADFDATGCKSPRDATEWIKRLEIAQSPGVAAVQVMTIHKSKGLGFDVVVLPNVPNDSVPQTKNFEIARGETWISDTPPAWVRRMSPEITEAESLWTAAQRYEAICMLYVALTRAKRGLYVLLDRPSEKSSPDKASLSNWIQHSALSSESADEILFEEGKADWFTLIEPLDTAKLPSPLGKLQNPVRKRATVTPSQSKNKTHAPTHSPSGMKFGSEVHALMEQITWIDEGSPALSQSDAANAVAKLIASPAIASLLKRNGKSIDLFREQSADAIVDGQLMTGIIDRLHLHRDSSGIVNRVEIIDYKTDAVATAHDLVDRYSGQMHAYQSTLQKIHPNAEIVPILISVKHAELVHL